MLSSACANCQQLRFYGNQEAEGPIHYFGVAIGDLNEYKRRQSSSFGEVDNLCSFVQLIFFLIILMFLLVNLNLLYCKVDKKNYFEQLWYYSAHEHINIVCTILDSGHDDFKTLVTIYC